MGASRRPPAPGGRRTARFGGGLVLAVGAGLLFGCGAAAGSAAGATTRATPPPAATAPPGPGLDVGRLASLANYAYRADINGFPLAGSVYSPSDWRIDTPAVILHVGGYNYSQSGSVWYRTPAPVDATTSLAYATVVSQFESFVHAPGTSVNRGGACQVAQVAGRTWTAAARGGAAGEASVCVADSTGALLSLTMSAGSGASSAGAIGTTFTVTGIGNVAPIAAPPSYQAG